MSKGVKLLISGRASSGKTTKISEIKNALVLVSDDKSFPFKMAHFRHTEYEGAVSLKNLLIEKIRAYKEKFGSKPDVVIIDSITHLYQQMYVWAEANNKGFEKFNAMQSETLSVNALLERLLIDNGMSVVITAHTVFNESTQNYEIPAVGKFKESGGWLSLVDNAVHISTEYNRRTVYLDSIKYPARSTIEVKQSLEIDEYSVQEHIDKLLGASNEADDFSI